MIFFSLCVFYCWIRLGACLMFGVLVVFGACLGLGFLIYFGFAVCFVDVWWMLFVSILVWFGVWV